jgi:hypothetical protein
MARVRDAFGGRATTVRHRTSAYLNNRLEQDHRGIKGRYRPMRGFGSVVSAGRFCRSGGERLPVARHTSQRVRSASLELDPGTRRQVPAESLDKCAARPRRPLWSYERRRESASKSARSFAASS